MYFVNQTGLTHSYINESQTWELIKVISKPWSSTTNIRPTPLAPLVFSCSAASVAVTALLWLKECSFILDEFLQQLQTGRNRRVCGCKVTTRNDVHEAHLWDNTHAHTEHYSCPPVSFPALQPSFLASFSLTLLLACSSFYSLTAV